MKDIREDWITLDNVVWEEEIRRLRVVEYAVSPSLFALGFNINVILTRYLRKLVCGMILISRYVPIITMQSPSIHNSL